MSEGRTIGAQGATNTGAPNVRAAIARAAQVTGVDFRYLMAQAQIESNLDPDAHAATSSAAGLYQFTTGTWVDTLGRHAAEHGLGWVSDAIRGGGQSASQSVGRGGAISDAAMRAHIMALRYDPSVSALMAADLASDNAAALTVQLGRQPDAAELYLAHFLGAQGATQFLSAMSLDPSQAAASVLPAAAAANRAIFFQGSQPRSLAGVMDLIRGKVTAAMDGGSFESPTASAGFPRGYAPDDREDASIGPIAREFQAGLLTAATPARSMSQTLASTFGASGDAAPAHVRNAYAKLASFGL